MHSNNSSFTSLPFSISPSTWKTIRISSYQKLKLEHPVSEMFVKDFIMQECDSISSEMVPRAHQLSVSSCHNLRFILHDTGEWSK